MNITSDTKLDFSDVLLKPKRSTLGSRKEVSLHKTFTPKYGLPFSGTLVVCANMATGTFEMLRSFMQHEMFVAVAKHNNEFWIEEYRKDPRVIEYGFYSIGMSDRELEGFRAFYDHVQDDRIKLCIDIANGYTEKFSDFVAKVRSEFPKIVIAAGNVVTPEMTEQLILSGADYVKVGIGPGSHCSTRRQTGIGYPQLSAILECADAAHGLGGGVIADGGIRTPGDCAKALCANADMVMIGGMFAGTDECDGEVIERTFQTDEVTVEGDSYTPVYETRKYKLFYGMSSKHAQEQHGSGMKEYRASEGTVSSVLYKGPVEVIVMDLLGGLRSTGTYIGAKTVKDFGKCATFIKVNRVHDRNL